MPAGSAPVVAPAPATVPEGGLIGEDVSDPDPQPAGAVLPVEAKPGTAVGAPPAGDVASRPQVPGGPDGSFGSGQPKIMHEPAPAGVGPSKREATPDAARLYAAAAGQSGAEGAAAISKMDSPPPMPEPRALATVRGGANSASPPAPAMPRADGLPSPEPRSPDTGRSKATETKRTGLAEARGNTVEAAAVSFRQLVGEARRAGASQDGSDKAGGERGLPRADQATSRDDPALGMQTVRPTDAGEFRTSAPSDGAPTVRRIGRQIAAQPVLRSGGRAEFNLAPEELGHLRLSVETSEAGLRIVIEAARPETADLMRRHVEALRQELRQEGLGQVGVSIGGGDSAAGRETSHPGRRGSEAAAGASGPVAATSVLPLSDTPAPRTRNAGGALDLRF
ncbi:hypothetical protein FHG66_05155 [Rubellimicrobium rubrum]|uniref:Flagellar hook-length control protein-like C-terminal domain-containing protein n=2 Tax=Rubellimicrobium rubrum TaxID=2585369 RepID=A0A5C4MZ69_9RHOB|nr:hypothetical protein FHG66_05155 [Rubellimicrobium rubrum]